MQLTRCVVQMNVRKSSYAYKFIDVEVALVLVVCFMSNVKLFFLKLCLNV